MAHPPPPAPIFTLRSAKEEVTAVHFTKGNELVSGHSCGHVQIWDLQIYRVNHSWCAHSDHRVQWIGSREEGGGTVIVSYGRDGFVHFWNVVEGAAKATRSIQVDCCTHCPCDVTDKYLATPTNDSSVQIWTLDNSFTKLNQKPHLANCGMVMVIKLVTLANKVLLLLGYESGIITVCDLEATSSSKVPLSRLSAHSEPITCLEFHTETMRGISGSADDNLVVWNMTAKGELSLRVSKSITNPGVASVKVHPNGIYVAVGSWDKRLRIFSWKTMNPLAILDFHSGTIQCLDFVRRTDGLVLLVAGSQDGRISLWDLYNQIQK